MNSITLVTGPPGSGKSTIGKRVATHFPRCLLISVDDLREMMITGCSTPDGGITEELIEQFQMARTSAIHMAEVYSKRGVEVIIDDVCVPSVFADQYAPLFANPSARRILLMPNLGVLRERMKKRAGPWDHILVDKVSEVFAYLETMSREGWIVLDTSEWTIEQTVQEVLSRLRVNTANPPITNSAPPR